MWNHQDEKDIEVIEIFMISRQTGNLVETFNNSKFNWKFLIILGKLERILTNEIIKESPFYLFVFLPTYFLQHNNKNSIGRKMVSLILLTKERQLCYVVVVVEYMNRYVRVLFLISFFLLLLILCCNNMWNVA